VPATPGASGRSGCCSSTTRSAFSSSAGTFSGEPPELARPDESRRELLVAEAGGGAKRALWFFAEDRDVDWPTAAWDATVEPVDGGQRVRVTARTGCCAT
jgi:hypothetical protein